VLSSLDIKDLPSASRVSHYYFAEIYPLAQKLKLYPVSPAVVLILRMDWKDQEVFSCSMTPGQNGNAIANSGRMFVAMEPVPNAEGMDSIFVLRRSHRQGVVLDATPVGQKVGPEQNRLTWWLLGNRFIFENQA
jgi:hypothetical protein